MKLGIDLRCLPADGSAGGGIAHAARAVTKEILKQMGDDVVLYIPKGAMFDEGAHGRVSLPDPRRSSFVKALRNNRCDLLLVPSGAVSPGLPVPAIPWVHDCDIFDHPEWFPQSWLKRQITTRMFLSGLRRSPHIFAVSEYTKKAIERLVPSARGKITITGEGGDDALMSMTGSRHGEHRRDRPFVLILGTLEPRKNIPLICRIWPDVATAVPNVDLVIAGQDGWKTEEIYRAIKHAGPNVIRLKNISDEQRRGLLRSAEFVLVPSFSEGFGLVALEAIQTGTPVLTSNRGALPEVVGNREWVLDPEDEKGWREKMVQVLTDQAVRDGMIQTQSKRKELFSWEKTARMITAQLFYNSH